MIIVVVIRKKNNVIITIVAVMLNFSAWGFQSDFARLGCIRV